MVRGSGVHGGILRWPESLCAKLENRSSFIPTGEGYTCIAGTMIGEPTGILQFIL